MIHKAFTLFTYILVFIVAFVLGVQRMVALESSGSGTSVSRFSGSRAGGQFSGLREGENRSTNQIPQTNTLLESVQSTTSKMYQNMYDTAHNWWFTGNNGCSVTKGQSGGVYYRFYAIGPCEANTTKKKIAGAVSKALAEVWPDWIPENSCISMTNAGRWEGMLIIGPTKDAWAASCKAEKKDIFDAACSSAHWYEKCHGKLSNE
ncbi:hypothetical protein OXX69_005685 [Metschnikowia pulcherrima]